MKQNEVIIEHNKQTQLFIGQLRCKLARRCNDLSKAEAFQLASMMSRRHSRPGRTEKGGRNPVKRDLLVTHRVCRYVSLMHLVCATSCSFCLRGEVCFAEGAKPILNIFIGFHFPCGRLVRTSCNKRDLVLGREACRLYKKIHALLSLRR